MDWIIYMNMTSSRTQLSFPCRICGVYLGNKPCLVAWVYGSNLPPSYMHPEVCGHPSKRSFMTCSNNGDPLDLESLMESIILLL